MRPLRLLLVFALLLTARPLAAQDMGEYRLGPRDLLEIRVLEIPELNLERRIIG